MIDFSEVKGYLPQYLSKEASENLFTELKDFPDNIDARMYTNYLAGNQIIYQGDGLSGLLSINLPSPEIRAAPGMILSNTCDIFTENEKLVATRLVFATIFQLEKFRNLLIRNFVETGKKIEDSINGFIAKVKKQHISHIFYLPAGYGLKQDSFDLFDRVNNLPLSLVNEVDIPQKRIFTLSDYGFYLFLFKLSIHFTRIRENISRVGDQAFDI